MYTQSHSTQIAILQKQANNSSESVLTVHFGPQKRYSLERLSIQSINSV